MGVNSRSTCTPLFQGWKNLTSLLAVLNVMKCSVNNLEYIVLFNNEVHTKFTRNRMSSCATKKTCHYVKVVLYAFFWVIPWRLNFICRRFGTHCPFHLHRRVGMRIWLRLFSSQTVSRVNTPTFSNLLILCTYLPMKMEQTECSKTSAYEIQTPGNYPEENIQHTEHGESLKSRNVKEVLTTWVWLSINNQQDATW